MIATKSDQTEIPHMYNMEVIPEIERRNRKKKKSANSLELVSYNKNKTVNHARTLTSLKLMRPSSSRTIEVENQLNETVGVVFRVAKSERRKNVPHLVQSNFLAGKDEWYFPCGKIFRTPAFFIQRGITMITFESGYNPAVSKKKLS